MPRCSNGGTMSTAKPRSRPAAARNSGTLPVLAEMEVEPDRHAGGTEAVHQDAADEILRRQARERGVEGQDHGAVEAGGGEQAQLVALVGEPEQRHVRPKKCARMRLEGERRRRGAQVARARHRRRDDGAMAAMHAVEIADGEHRALERIEARPVVAHGDERLARLRHHAPVGPGRERKRPPRRRARRCRRPSPRRQAARGAPCRPAP